MNLHFPSALVGGAFCSLLFLSVGAQKAQLMPLEFEKSLSVEGIPAPDQFVRIDYLESFTVPAGKRFVPMDAARTGTTGSNPTNIYLTMQVDGQPFARFYTANGGAVVPEGLFVEAGREVALVDQTEDHAYALLGYVTDV